MISKSKLILIVAIAAVSITSPVLAKSRHHSGTQAYAMVVGSAHEPALTGGGSYGYNESVAKNW